MKPKLTKLGTIVTDILRNESDKSKGPLNLVLKKKSTVVAVSVPTGEENNIFSLGLSSNQNSLCGGLKVDRCRLIVKVLHKNEGIIGGSILAHFPLIKGQIHLRPTVLLV